MWILSLDVQAHSLLIPNFPSFYFWKTQLLPPTKEREGKRFSIPLISTEFTSF